MAERTELDLWPYEEARRLAERVGNYPPERAVIFESGFGPSGLPHLGTMGEVLRALEPGGRLIVSECVRSHSRQPIELMSS